MQKSFLRMEKGQGVRNASCPSPVENKKSCLATGCPMELSTTKMMKSLLSFFLRMKKAVETCHAFRRWEGGNNNNNNNNNLTTGSETLAQLFGSKQRNNHTEIAEHMNL